MSLLDRIALAWHALRFGEMPAAPPTTPIIDNPTPSAPLAPSAGSKELPHLFSKTVLKFYNYCLFYHVQEEVLILVTAWRQKHLAGRFEWVLVQIDPRAWAQVNTLQAFKERRAGDILDLETRIVYRAAATPKQAAEMMAYQEAGDAD